MENTGKQNKCQYEWLKPYHFKKGQSGNPNGVGKRGKSIKTYLKERFLAMSEKEKDEFLNQISPELAWRMSEGNPPQEVEHSGDLSLPFTIKIELDNGGKQIGEGTSNQDVPKTI